MHAWASGHADGKPMVSWNVWTVGLGVVHGVSHASRCRQDTHTTRFHSHCIIALRSWEAHWGFDELPQIHGQVNPTGWAQVGQESEQVGQVSLHLLSSVRGVRKLNGGCGAHWLPWMTRS